MPVKTTSDKTLRNYKAPTILDPGPGESAQTRIQEENNEEIEQEGEVQNNVTSSIDASSLAFVMDQNQVIVPIVSRQQQENTDNTYSAVVTLIQNILDNKQDIDNAMKYVNDRFSKFNQDMQLLQQLVSQLSGKRGQFSVDSIKIKVIDRIKLEEDFDVVIKNESTIDICFYSFFLHDDLEKSETIQPSTTGYFYRNIQYYKRRLNRRQ